ncbi:MAG TPA: ribonuclease III [Saprospiraceae bacterium]|nr:ribonuclease III [Saprospiraceae bacterium]
MRLIRKFYNSTISPDKELARSLKPILGFTPSRLQLFKLAFYHRSMINGQEIAPGTNERLEFLGDAILSTVVAEYLFNKYPTQDEGFLTKMRSKIVKRKTLNHVAEQMGLDIILSDYSLGNMSKSMLGNALEALVGALYIEFGYAKTRDYVISKILMKYLDFEQLENTDDNYKSILLEYCQKNGKTINYNLINRFKMDKRDRFRVGVEIDGEIISTAEDFNKKSAEQLASKRALHQLGVDHYED